MNRENCKNPSKTGETNNGMSGVLDSWTSKSPMPAARSGHSAVGINGKLYVLGGTDALGALLSSSYVC
jgi:N-acetylneuraminic acid mutarotase